MTRSDHHTHGEWRSTSRSLSCTSWLVLAATMLTALASADPVDWSAYTQSFEIAFPGYSGTETLTDFPVLIRLSAERNGFLYNKCRQPNGGDLRFSDADGNLLASEVDTWNPNGESLVWVKVPSLSTSTRITAHYGCVSPAVMNPQDVWSNGFVGVWHMGDATLPMTDSVNGGTSLSENQADATLPGQAGLVGNAIAFNQLNSHKGCLQTTDQRYKTSGKTDYTVEFWSYQDSFDPTTPPYSTTYMQETGSSAIWRAYCIETTQYGSNGKTVVTISLANAKPDNPSTGNRYPNRAEWVYQNFRVSDSSQFYQGLYQDGYRNSTIASANYASKGGITNDTANTTLFIGNSSSGNAGAFPGMIDEVRISSVARSDDWMNATYDTIHDDGFAVFSLSNDWKRYAHTFSVSFPGAPATELADFPVLVKLSEMGIPGFRYTDCLKGNGGDLRFSDAEGHLLDSEIDTWNPDGESLIWVKVPSLTNNAVIKAYYGWEWAPSVNSTNVWSNGYLGVWHLNESTSPLADATGGGKNFTRSSSHVDMVSLGGAGLLGNAPEFAMTTNQDGTHDGYLSFKDNDNKFTGKTMTIEMWTYQRENGATNRRLLYKKDKALAFDFNLQYNSSQSQSTVTFSFVGTNMLDEVSAVTKNVRARYKEEGIGVWRHYALVYDSVDAQRLLAYVNGTNSGSSDDSVAVNQDYSVVPSGGTVYLGNLSSKRAFPGKIDEVRISNVARSAGWLRTTYDMIQGNADFATYSNAKENALGTLVIFR